MCVREYLKEKENYDGTEMEEVEHIGHYFLSVLHKKERK